MKAIGAFGSLPADDERSLQDLDIPRPDATGRELLIRVKAVSVNPVDGKIRMSIGEQTDKPRILGWDCAGVVEQTGGDCTLFKPGDEVFYAGDVTRAGCNSEFHLVDERIAGRKPEALTFEQSAAMPLTTITAWEALFDRLGISSKGENGDESVLIIGGAGGVGSIAIQLAKKVAGLKVIATASRPETAQWCLDLGADHVVNHRKSLSDEFKREGLAEVNHILCLAATAQHWQAMSEVIAPQGGICLIVDTGEPVNINIFKPKSVRIAWEFMFTRPRFQTADLKQQGALLSLVSCLLDESLIRHTQTEHFGELNAVNLRRAHAKVESGSMIGKLVLSAP